MNSTRRNSRGGDMVVLILFAIVIVVAKWIWAHRVEIGVGLVIVALIAGSIACFYALGRSVQERQREHDAIARRADLQEWQLANGNSAGIYGFIHSNDLTREFPHR